jgi:hypothetical protein
MKPNMFHMKPNLFHMKLVQSPLPFLSALQQKGQGFGQRSPHGKFWTNHAILDFAILDFTILDFMVALLAMMCVPNQGVNAPASFVRRFRLRDLTGQGLGAGCVWSISGNLMLGMIISQG